MRREFLRTTGIGAYDAAAALVTTAREEWHRLVADARAPATSTLAVVRKNALLEGKEC